MVQRMEVLTAIDSLDELLYRAKPVPLSDDVRVDPAELARLVEDIRVAIPIELTRAGSSDVPALVDRLDAVSRDAKPVPMSRAVRVDKERIYSICDELRASLPDDLRQAPLRQAALDSLPARSISAEEAIRSLPELLHEVRFGGETIRITLNGTPMADLRPPAEGDMASE